MSPLAAVMSAMEIPRSRLLAAVGAAVATLAASFALAAVSAWLVTTAWTRPPVLDLTVATVAVRALGVSRGVFRWLDRMLSHDVALRGVVSLRTGLFTALARRDGDAISRLRRGDLLARLGDDAQEIANHVINAVVPALVSVVMTLIVTITLLPISWIAALAMLASLVVAGVLAPMAALRAAAFAEDAVVEHRTQVTAQALDTVDDASVLRVQGRLESTLAELHAQQCAHDAAMDRAALPSALAAGTVPLVMIPALLSSVLAAGPLWTQGIHPAGLIGILLLLPLSSYEAAQNLPAAASQLARSRAAARRLVATAGTPDPRAVTSEAERRAASRGFTSSLVRATWQDYTAGGIGERGQDVEDQDLETAATPLRADADNSDGHPAGAVSAEPLPTPHLRARHLTAGWAPDAPRVENLELDLPPGGRLAIIGPSGAGKSTLLATLAGLLRPLQGEVTLDDADLADLSPTEQRCRIVMFAEDAHVFATTVAENVRVARGDVTDAEIAAALEAVGLGTWVEQLPEGLATVLGPDGTTVSGGERRRLLLARAVVRSAPITLLDEPTEHLDPELGDALLGRLLGPSSDPLLPAAATVVVVTHRVEAIPPGTAVLDLAALPHLA